MPQGKSKAHKYWNKFVGWASHEGQVGAEVPQALDEFLAAPDRIPEDARGQVRALFEGWFLLERPLLRARQTPLELFLSAHESKLKATELGVYRRFARENRFGFFKVEEAVYGESMNLRLMPGGERFRVVELEGSKAASKGGYLIGRLIPFEDHWALEGLVGAFPEDAAYDLDRLFQAGGRRLKPGELRPRHVLPLFMPRVDWSRESPPRVKARLAMLLQRWGVSDLTAAAVEDDIAQAHRRKDASHPLLKAVLERAPSAEDAKEAAEVLTALWNLTLPPAAEEPVPRGPKETALLRDLQRVAAAKISETAMLDDPHAATELARKVVREWFETPQKELDGKSPKEVILAERKSMGNPREELGISVLPASLDIGRRESEGARLAEKAAEHLRRKEAAEALACLEEAYGRLKDHALANRVLGNMAAAYAMLGRREEALEALRAALKSNPDYETARRNLSLLEGMSPEEFERRHKNGFFEKMALVRPD